MLNDAEEGARRSGLHGDGDTDGYEVVATSLGVGAVMTGSAAALLASNHSDLPLLPTSPASTPCLLTILPTILSLARSTVARDDHSSRFGQFRSSSSRASSMISTAALSVTATIVDPRS